MSLSILSVFLEERIQWSTEISIAQNPPSMKSGGFFASLSTAPHLARVLSYMASTNLSK